MEDRAVTSDTGLTIIGAGPFGLATAAEAIRRGIPYRMFGKARVPYMTESLLASLRCADGYPVLGHETIVNAIEAFH